ncbi:MAG: hypothetical protein K9J81_08040 [Desulfohalobiaceae bacterium]|nr:hypothetical protein [Desulfohalobiaceae bacterium]
MGIQTNDPDQPWHQVVVTGRVEKFAEIRPERVRLKGTSGEKLFQNVLIIPRKIHPFTIQNIKAKYGKNINYTLIERCADGNNQCVIKVENTRREEGRYVDVLNIRTDCDIHPTIPIYITGLIRQEG